MTDKRHDERDIDEILASIDEMLSQKKPYGIKSDARKASVEEGIKASKAKLSLSSSNQEQAALDDVDIDEFLTLGMDDVASAREDASPSHQDYDAPVDGSAASSEPEHTPQAESNEEAEGNDEEVVPRQRILLTEDLLEPSAQEALPLWVAQDENTEQDSVSQADDAHDEPSHAEQTQDSNASEAKVHTNDDAEQAAFDVEEALSTDTVYKLEPINDTTGEHSELLEPMMQEVLAQHEDNKPQEPQTEAPKALLSPDELDDLVQAVSDDVSKQVNDHLQTWLPRLISIAIKKHLDAQQNKKQ